jgi:hypothetical protein
MEAACVLGGRAVFHGVKANRARFTNAEFRGYADFSQAQFGACDLSGAFFEKEANFDQVKFGQSVICDGVMFQDRLTLPWRLLLAPQPPTWPWSERQTRLTVHDPRTFEALQRAYQRSGDREGQNEALYQEKLLSRQDAWECWLWGYGVRPWRVAKWLGILFILCTMLYLLGLPTPPRMTVDYRLRGGVLQQASKKRDLPRWQRFWTAAVFSARTAWHFGYGPEHAQGFLWKGITTTQMLASKVLAILFLKAVANTSPLLNDIASKFVGGG